MPVSELHCPQPAFSTDGALTKRKDAAEYPDAASFFVRGADTQIDYASKSNHTMTIHGMI